MTTAPYAELVAAAAALGERPAAFVLGSGMGPITARVASRVAVAFADIPGMAAPTVAGHGGTLTLGDWAGRPVLIFSGRLHFYEGRPWAKVVRPVEVLAELGARALILTNASGGINLELEPGSLMALTDHLEWNEPHFWRNAPRQSPYDPRLNDELTVAASRVGVMLHRGVYAAVTGPNYETPAEVRALRSCGADAVGMSTAREARRAAELGLPVAAVSCVANRAAGLSATPLSHREVLEAVAASAERLARLLEAFVASGGREAPGNPP
jgi:purine-nucleoside phosphorylase